MARLLLPWPLYSLGLWLVTFLEWLVWKIVPPEEYVLRRATALIDSQVIQMCCKLQLSEIIGNDIVALDALADKIDLSPKTLLRLLRAAHQIGIFRLHYSSSGGVSVGNNAHSRVLSSNSQSSLKPLVQWLGFETQVFQVEHFEYALRTAEKPEERTAFEKAFGTNLFSFLKENDGHRKLFTEGMKAQDSLGVLALVQDYAWKKHSRILDIGGASGSFLAAVLQAPGNSSLGVLCDLPQVVEESQAAWHSDPALRSVSSRVSFTPVDFFQPGTIPAAKEGDCYLMRNILHDWDDEKALQILQNMQSTMQHSNSTLAIVEMNCTIKDRSPVGEGVAHSDMVMMQLRGKERSKTEWEDLLARAGFKMMKVVPTRSLYSVLVAKPVKRIPQQKAALDGKNGYKSIKSI